MKKNMKKTFIVGALLVALSVSSSASVAFAQTTTGRSPNTTVATTASADQSAQSALLIKQIEMLKTQIMELQKSKVTLEQNVTQLQDELKLARIMKRGDKGDDVRLLQELLATDSTIFNAEATGFFGPKTVEAIKKLQEKMGLEKVGNVGPKTLERLNEILMEGDDNSGKIPHGLLKEHGLGGTIVLHPVGALGIKGHARIKMESMSGATGTMATSGKVRVRIELSEKDMMMMSSTSTGTATPMIARPAHIHSGSCAAQGAVKFPLNPVVDGRSETVLEVSLKDLLTAMPLYVNVHKSAEEMAIAVSCGDVKTPSSVWKKHDMDLDKKMGDMMEKKNHLMDDNKEKSAAVGSTSHQFGRGSQMRGNSPVVEARKFNVVASNFAFDVKEIRVKKGDVVNISLKSADGFHDLVINEFNARSKQISTGAESNVVFTADKVGTFEYFCSVGNHRAMGMVGKLIVE